MTLPCVPWAFLGLVQSAAKLLVQLGLGQVALDIGHLLGKPLPRRLVDVVDIELGCGVADKAFQHVVKLVAPAFGAFLAVRATPINANFSGSTLVRERL